MGNSSFVKIYTLLNNPHLAPYTTDDQCPHKYISTRGNRNILDEYNPALSKNLHIHCTAIQITTTTLSTAVHS